MKGVVAFLVLLNLLVFGYSWYHRAAEPVAKPMPASGTLPRVQALASLQPDNAQPQPVNVPVREEETVSYCARVGWFASREDADSAFDQLSTGVDVYRIEERSEPLPPYHWVMVPPQPREAARELYRALRAQGVDAYLIPSGEHANGVSLGLFESLASAERVKRQRIQQNIDARLVMLPRNRISYALVFEVGNQPMLSEATQDAEKYEIYEYFPCKSVATQD
ncbi:MAG: hypothetical protein LAT63_17330 [Marinobacter sp.]|nr:hypothetical protein [Marinobacter sp.]